MPANRGKWHLYIGLSATRFCRRCIFTNKKTCQKISTTIDHLTLKYFCFTMPYLTENHRVEATVIWCGQMLPIIPTPDPD